MLHNYDLLLFFVSIERLFLEVVDAAVEFSHEFVVVRFFTREWFEAID